jgi:hypothetical protein
MTCEVAVMNKRGVALAADSAVTLGNGKKIYHTAEKLFCLSPAIPVAIMTFGAADMMNVPWETVVKIYAQKLGNRQFDTLDQYAKDLLSFIEGASSLFPPEDQKSHVEGAVRTVWSGLYRAKLSERIGPNAEASESDKIAALEEIVHTDHHVWEKEYSDLEGFGAEYGARVVKTYEDVIAHVEKQVFEGMKLCNLKSDLRKTVSLMYGKQSQDWLQAGWFSSATIGGVEKEFSEMQSRRRYHCVDSRPAKSGSRDTTANSLWQQGRRDEAWRPLWLGGVVCATRS